MKHVSVVLRFCFQREITCIYVNIKHQRARFNINFLILPQVVHWDKYLHIPPEAQLTEAAEDLILRLCCDQNDRLGAEGADKVMQHPFFGGIDFLNLR